jgi:hypothetical protein
MAAKATGQRQRRRVSVLNGPASRGSKLNRQRAFRPQPFTATAASTGYGAVQPDICGVDATTRPFSYVAVIEDAPQMQLE